MIKECRYCEHFQLVGFITGICHEDKESPVYPHADDYCNRFKFTQNKPQEKEDGKCCDSYRKYILYNLIIGQLPAFNYCPYCGQDLLQPTQNKPQDNKGE